MSCLLNRLWLPLRTPYWLKRGRGIRHYSAPDTSVSVSICSLALNQSKTGLVHRHRSNFLDALFVRRDSKTEDRDIFNERPTREEQSIAFSAPTHGKPGP